MLAALALALAMSGPSLLPLDAVAVRCPQDARLNFERLIGHDGQISVPGFGTLTLAGLTPEDASVRILRALEASGDLRRLEIQVSRVADPRTPVRVRGTVAQRLDLRLRRPTRLSEVLSLAGPLPEADLEKIALSDVAGRVLVADFTKGDDPTVRPGDRIEVPRSSRPVDVFVLGAVTRPGAYPWKEGLTPEQAIALAGGATLSGDMEKIEIRRKDQPIALTTNLRLERGDVVRVGLRPERRFISVQGAVARPGVFEFVDGLTLTQAIGLAGGLSRQARSTTVTLTPKGGPRKRIDLGAIRAGKIPDVELRPFDILEVSLFVHPASTESRGG